MRLDTTVKPTQFHGATVSREEMKWLQRIQDIIRMGRVQHISGTTLSFKQDEYSLPNNTLFVDCSATPISKEINNIPVFQENTIIPQTVRSYQHMWKSIMILKKKKTNYVAWYRYPIMTPIGCVD